MSSAKRRLAAAASLLALLAPAAAQGAGRVDPYGLSLSWVGDMAFSSDEGLPAGGVGGAIGPLRRELRADLVTGNLEGTLTYGGASKCPGGSGGDCFAFRAPPAYARGLHRVGFGLVNVANNHSNDFGDTGQASTAAALRGARARSPAGPAQVTVVRVGGIRVAAVGFAPYPWAAPLLDIPAAQSLVRAARRRAPIVLAFIHAGAEGADKTHTPFGTEHAFGENRGTPRRSPTP